MISLSGEALATVMRLSQPLAPADRARFLHETGERLRGQAEVDEGLVHRTARELQRKSLNGSAAVAAAIAELQTQQTKQLTPRQAWRQRRSRGG
jgi:hypothetical protein